MNNSSASDASPAPLKFVASSPRGFGDLLAAEPRAGRVRCPRARARRGIFGNADGGLPRVPGVTRGKPRVPRGRGTRRAGRGAVLRSGARHRLACAHRSGADPGLRLHRKASHHHAHSLRLAAAQGCHLRPVARCHGTTARYLARTSGGARARTCQRTENHGVAGPFGRGTASPRLSHTGR